MLHIATLALDSYAPFSLQAMLVPGAAAWRPGAMALGICALYALVIVDVSSRFRSQLPKRVWRGLHALSVLVYAAALGHAFLAGPDTVLVWVRLVVVAVVVVDLGLLARRVQRSLAKRNGRAPARSRATAPAAPAGIRGLPGPPGGASLPPVERVVPTAHTGQSGTWRGPTSTSC